VNGDEEVPWTTRARAIDARRLRTAEDVEPAALPISPAALA
jgi:hypothetical protein